MLTSCFIFTRFFIALREYLGFSLALRAIVFCLFSICFSLCFSLGFSPWLIERALAEEEVFDTDFALSGLDNPASNNPASASTRLAKKFRFFTKASTYLRYGGVRISDATNLIGYSEDPRIRNREDFTPPWEGIAEQFAFANNYDNYGAPLFSQGSFRFAPYELILGFEARGPLILKMAGGVRVSFDALEAGELLSGANWGGRSVYPAQHFSSGPLREGFVYLSHAKWGKVRLGITEGVSSLLDGGARSISASGGGLYGDFSRTPWQIHRLGLTLGRASSENFPKVQYLSPNFYGVEIGLEWFTNGQAAANKLLNLPHLLQPDCPRSLFYSDEQIFSYPLDFDGDTYLISDFFFPGSLTSSTKCWQLSSSASGWHSDASRFIMGGNLAISYEKSFSENLSLGIAASYGILSSSAHSVESPEQIANYFQRYRTVHKASSLEQAVSLGASLDWRAYSFFTGFVYLLPSEYKLEKLLGGPGSESGVISESGINGLIWSVGIRVGNLIPTKGKGKLGTLSLSYAQAITRDLRLSDGSDQVASLLNMGSSYPLSDNVLLVMDYWYGDAELIVPFDVINYPGGERSFTFYERRLEATHEVAIGLKMEF